MRININTDAVVAYTNKLEKLPKSALPVAIRGTLNDAAFSMKKDILPKVAKSVFKERQPNFFKANSRVEAATGFDIKTMSSTVGFVSSGLHNNRTNYAVNDLEQQEEGGIIKGRSFKPLAAARIGGKGNVKSNLRISQLLKGKLINVNDLRGGSKMQQLIKSVVHAGVGGFVLGGKILFKVTSIKRTKSGSVIFKKQKLFSFKKQGIAKVNGTKFVEKSAFKVQRHMENFYKVQAKKQFKKALG